MFLEEREIVEKSEPLSPGDEDWEKTKLRPSWDEELGDVDRRDDAVDKMRLEWRRQLDWLEIYVEKVMGWAKVVFKEWSSRPEALQASS